MFSGRLWSVKKRSTSTRWSVWPGRRSLRSSGWPSWRTSSARSWMSWRSTESSDRPSSQKTTRPPHPLLQVQGGEEQYCVFVGLGLKFSSSIYRRGRQLWAGHRGGRHACSYTPAQTSSPRPTSAAAPRPSFIHPAHCSSSVWNPQHPFSLWSPSPPSHCPSSSPRTSPTASNAVTPHPALTNPGPAHSHCPCRRLPPVSHPSRQSYSSSQSQTPYPHCPLTWTHLLHPSANHSRSSCPRHCHAPTDSRPAHRTHHRPSGGSHRSTSDIPPPGSLLPGGDRFPAHHGGPHHPHLHPPHPAACSS